MTVEVFTQWIYSEPNYEELIKLINYKSETKKYLGGYDNTYYVSGSGIPDEADYRLEQERKVPSWRRVCKSLLRNDYWCKGLSFTQHKSEAYEKYLLLMKKRREKWQPELFN